ncbi:GAF domain-containing protein, partial [Virgisporangium aurantiacum]|uniref:GAF domain-containing protein n=1 Tax=Virgisporangium aurantiacum TaxID=175570 RepID=UPI001950BA12
MRELPPAGLRAAIEITQIVSMPGGIDQRAEALLEPLRQVVPFEGAWISLLDPDRLEQPPLVSYGYPAGLVRYMSGPAGVAEIELLGLNRNSGATRLADLSVPLDEVRSWAEYLAPAGFRGGLAAALFTPDGRYLGMLGLNTDTAEHPTEAARDLIGALATTIAQAIDPMRAIGAAVRIVRNAQAAVVLTRAGQTLPLDGMPRHRLLAPGSAVLAVAADHLADNVESATFVCPDGGHRLARITVLSCARQPARHLAGVLVVSPPGNLHGLTTSDLEILGLLVEDWPVPRIGATLDLPLPTAADRVEHILTKLTASSRTVAVL